MGTVVMGKLENGTIREGDSLLVMPNKVFSFYLSVAPLLTCSTLESEAQFCI